ncbi:mucin-16 [Ixodes scapularis]|uniref:mucin-16 n=1 Tax=Ixodes scapularis TaxID=6945 RepID=UPI001C38C55E|nr:mucin-16 [Ixodes scapularis]
MRIVYLIVYLSANIFAELTSTNSEGYTTQHLSQHEVSNMNQEYPSQHVYHHPALRSSLRDEEQAQVRKRRSSEILKRQDVNGNSVLSCPEGFYYDVAEQKCIDENEEVFSKGSSTQSSSQSTPASKRSSEQSAIPSETSSTEEQWTTTYAKTYAVTKSRNMAQQELNSSITNSKPATLELTLSKNTSTTPLMQYETPKGEALTHVTMKQNLKITTVADTAQNSIGIALVSKEPDFTTMPSTEENVSEKQWNLYSPLNNLRSTVKEVWNTHKSSAQAASTEKRQVTEEGKEAKKMTSAHSETSSSYDFSTSPQERGTEGVTLQVTENTKEEGGGLSTKKDVHPKNADISEAVTQGKPTVTEKVESRYELTTSFTSIPASEIAHTHRPSHASTLSSDLPPTVEKSTTRYQNDELATQDKKISTEVSASGERIALPQPLTTVTEKTNLATLKQIFSTLSAAETAGVEGSSGRKRLALERTTHSLEASVSISSGEKIAITPFTSIAPSKSRKTTLNPNLVISTTNDSTYTTHKLKTAVEQSSTKPSVLVTTNYFGSSKNLSLKRHATTESRPLNITTEGIPQELAKGFDLTTNIFVTTPSDISSTINTAQSPSANHHIKTHTTVYSPSETLCGSSFCGSTDSNTQVHKSRSTLNDRIGNLERSSPKPAKSQSTATSSKLTNTNHPGVEVTEENFPVDGATEKSENPIPHEKGVSPLTVFLGALMSSIFLVSLIAATSTILRSRKKKQTSRSSYD